MIREILFIYIQDSLIDWSQYSFGTESSRLRDSLAIALLFGHFVLGDQIILLTNFKNEH